MPGTLFPEEYTKPLTAHDPQEALALANEYVYCFMLYDTEEIPTDLGPEFKITAVPKNRSSRYYIGGELFTHDEVVALGVDTVAANMRGNNWDTVIRCRTGNWQPFLEGDTLLEEAKK